MTDQDRCYERIILAISYDDYSSLMKTTEANTEIKYDETELGFGFEENEYDIKTHYSQSNDKNSLSASSDGYLDPVTGVGNESAREFIEVNPRTESNTSNLNVSNLFFTIYI